MDLPEADAYLYEIMRKRNSKKSNETTNNSK